MTRNGLFTLCRKILQILIDIPLTLGFVSFWEIVLTSTQIHLENEQHGFVLSPAPPSFALTSAPGLYKPFSEITRTSLQHALAEHSVTLSSTDIAGLMKAYDSLSTFPDVEPALKAISKDASINAYVFSNGTDAMVSSSVQQPPSLSPHASVFKSLITVQSVQLFKPHPEVYYYLAEKVGKGKDDMGSIWLVSGNPFDVVGARAVGMQAAWVDRAGNGWSDRLGELASGGPTVVCGGVEDAVVKIKEWVEKNGGKSGAGFNREEAAMGPG